MDVVRVWILRWLTGVTVVACTWSWACAQPDLHKSPLSWDRNIHKLFQRHCYDCHGAEDPSGNVNLAADVDLRLIRQHRSQWLIVREMLESKQMPPADEAQPKDEDREHMLQFLDGALALDCESQSEPGPPVLRRLTRVEYDHAIEDLTGMQLELSAGLPPDPVSYGFDNVGSQTPPPAQLELLHSAAKVCVAEILASQDARPQVWHRVFGVTPPDAQPREHARQVLQRFASRAFRRPVDEYYVNRLLRIYDRAIAEDQPHAHAVSHGLTAILISPRFLLRIEMDRPDETEPYPIDDYELASRLSFFLWSRPPDDRLLELAEAKQLMEPDVLGAEVERMLADDRAQALVKNFFFQWLDLRRVATHQPNPQLFPQVDDRLRDAMRREVEMLLEQVVRFGRPVTDVLSADYTFVNDRLAAFYGLDDQGGNGFRRVQLDGSRRGGVLTTAAMLMVQSDPGRTNIPRRGNFIAGQILGDAPPPPPDDVPALEESTDQQPRTLRETFELHRDHSECRSCHQKIDPLGFTLENYDAIGRWRDQEGAFDIDASATVDADQVIEGPAGLKGYLLSRREEYLQTLARRLMVYALGRGLHDSDECIVERMVSAAGSGEDKFSAMVMELVTSIPFTHRRNAEL